MYKQVGVWLDNETAYIIGVDGKGTSVKKIKSSVEDYHPVGGSRSNVPYGPQDKLSETKFLERRKHQFREYFNRIIIELQNAEQIYLFGPANAKIGLRRAIKESSALRATIVAYESADEMTENQKIAQVREFYKL